MTWLWLITPAWLKRALAWAGVGIAAIGGAWLTGRRSGAVGAENEGLRADAKATEAGRKATAGAKADLRTGKTPEEIVRANDGQW